MERNYKAIEIAAVDEMRKDLIKTVKDVTNFPDIVIHGFLRQMNYQVDQFFERYTEDYDNIFRKYNIFDNEIIATDINTEQCEVCYDTSSIAFQGCRHHFCESCLVTFVTMKITDDMDSDVVKCPAYKCNFLIDDALIAQLVSAETFQKYQKRIRENFISEHPKLKNCSGTDCNFIIQLLDTKFPSPIVCYCGHEFCFHCDFETSHNPIPCKMIKSWTKLLLRFGKTPASTEWIQNNTKPCPKCNRPILKHTGCDHMHCPMCGLNFNWSAVSTHVSKTPFFVPSEKPEVELKISSKRRKLDEKEENYDLEKIDMCTTKYVGALASYRDVLPQEFKENAEIFNAFKALKKCNHLLIVSAIIEFFTKDEKLVFFMYHEYELQQRTMLLEKALKQKIKPMKLKKYRKKYCKESTEFDINDLMIKCRTEYDVLQQMIHEIAIEEGY